MQCQPFEVIPLMSNLHLPSEDNTMHVFNIPQLFKVIKANRVQMVAMHNLLTPDILLSATTGSFHVDKVPQGSV